MKTFYRTEEQWAAYLKMFNVLPKGYLQLVWFCEDVENDEIPIQQTLKDLAAAFRAMMSEESSKKRPSVFMKAMGLHGKRHPGRPPSREVENRHYLTAVKVWLKMLEGYNKTSAVEAVAIEIDSICPNPKYVWEALRKHSDRAEEMAQIMRAAEAKEIQLIQDAESHGKVVKPRESVRAHMEKYIMKNR